MTPKLSLPSSPRLQLALQLGIATLMLFAGLTIVFGTLGIIDVDPDAGPARRITALLVGALVAALGLGLILVPLRELATAQGARGDARALFLGVRLLLQRVDLRSAVAAAALVPLAWGAWFALNGTQWPGPDAETLIDLVIIEFLLIHGFPFLAFAATVAHTPSPRQRAFGYALVGLLVLFYGLFAWQEAEWWGILGLVYLALPNILAFTHADDDGKVRATAIARWVVKIVTFFGTAMLLGERELQGPGNIEIALYYFGIQAAIELFRVAEIPQDLGAAWERLPPQKRPTIWAAS